MKTAKPHLNADQIQELTNFKREKERSATEAMRVMAILLVDGGSNSELIKNLTDYDAKYASNLRRKYLKHGLDSLKDRKGKQPRALLTKRQRLEIIKVITTANPRMFGFDVDYWTTAILGAFIKEQYGVQYKSKTPLTILFKEARFTYHKPDKQYRAKNPQVVAQWLEKNSPIIKAAFDDDETIVLVADEMMLSTQTTTQKIWLPQGEFPKIDVSSKRQIRCVYGALDVKSGREYAFKEMRADSQASCHFLDKLGNLLEGWKIMLIWDNASWHKSAEIKNFLATTEHRFHLINFPPYSPELNPQEHVWKQGRSHVTHNTFLDDIDKATDKFVRFLNDENFHYKFL